MKVKRCTKCKRLLSFDCFHERKLNKDGLWKYCKNCRSQQAKEHRLKLKVEVLGHYADGLPKCACCGDLHIEFLGIDHIDGGGKEHRRKIGGSTSQLYCWLKRNNYPEGFRVLCHNCNFSLGLYGYCPHKSNKKFKKEAI